VEVFDGPCFGTLMAQLQAGYRSENRRLLRLMRSTTAVNKEGNGDVCGGSLRAKANLITIRNDAHRCPHGAPAMYDITAAKAMPIEAGVIMGSISAIRTDGGRNLRGRLPQLSRAEVQHAFPVG